MTSPLATECNQELKTRKEAQMNDVTTKTIATVLYADERGTVVEARFPDGRRRTYHLGCVKCLVIAVEGDVDAPRHEPKPTCESGKRPHCTCDFCY